MEIAKRYKKSTLWVTGSGRERRWTRNDNCITTPWMPSSPGSGCWSATRKGAQENYREWRAYLSRILAE